MSCRKGGEVGGRILTVTLNTALDITYRVRGLRPYASHRVTSVTERPGGKGLNVARVLAALGHEVTVTGFTGGATGRAYRTNWPPFQACWTRCSRCRVQLAAR